MDLHKFFDSKPPSKEAAKDRLKLILIHDRADLSPELLENIKCDIFKVLSKYVDIDTNELEVKLTRTGVDEGCLPALIANIPIKSMKVRR